MLYSRYSGTGALYIQVVIDAGSTLLLVGKKQTGPTHAVFYTSHFPMHTRCSLRRHAAFSRNRAYRASRCRQQAVQSTKKVPPASADASGERGRHANAG